MKRTPLKRGKPPQRKTEPKRTKWMRKTSQTRKRKAKEAREFFEDSKGVRWHELGNHFPKRVADWPKLRIVKDREVITDHLKQREGKPCPLCGGPDWGYFDVHHIIGGAGRSDEHCNLLRICTGCHEEIQHAPEHEPRVWRAKWEVDKRHTDWRRLCELRRKMPDFDLED